MSRSLPRLSAFFLCSSLAAGLAQAQTAPAKTNATRLPQQVLQTGAEDAPAAPSAARTVSPGTSEAVRLENELIEMTRESDEGLVAVRASDGSRRVNLQGRFMAVMVATPTSDGKEDLACVTGKEALDAVKLSQAVRDGKAPKPAPRAHSHDHAMPAPAIPEEK
jgi:hypothetical protein